MNASSFRPRSVVVGVAESARARLCAGSAPLTLTLALTLCAGAIGCSTSDPLQRSASTEPPPAVDVPVEEAPPTPTPRTLVDGPTLSTSPVNLITDPGFGLVGEDSDGSSFLAFDEETFDQVTLTSTLDSRSPAAFGGGVGIIRANEATNARSTPVLVLASFQGGTGPFFAQVWVSKSTITGKPAPLSIGDGGFRASITEETPEGRSIDLAPVEGATRARAGRTWQLLRAEITTPLPYGGFLILRAGTSGGQIHVAAPQVVAQPLLDGLKNTRSSSHATLARARVRETTPAERTAIAKYKARPPRLLPASPLSPTSKTRHVAD